MHDEHRKYRMEAELRAFRMILDSGFPIFLPWTAHFLPLSEDFYDLRMLLPLAGTWSQRIPSFRFWSLKNGVITDTVTSESWIVGSCCHAEKINPPVFHAVLWTFCNRNSSRGRVPHRLVSYCMTAFAKIKALVSLSSSNISSNHQSDWSS